MILLSLFKYTIILFFPNRILIVAHRIQLSNNGENGHPCFYCSLMETLIGFPLDTLLIILWCDSGGGGDGGVGCVCVNFSLS